MYSRLPPSLPVLVALYSQTNWTDRIIAADTSEASENPPHTELVHVQQRPHLASASAMSKDRLLE